MTNTKYNGWENYETWNVALWINNDEGLYHIARQHRHAAEPYNAFIKDMRELGWDDPDTSPISYKTPDDVAWNDSGLDLEALDEMISEL